jgi:hypothetical protein
MHNMTFEQRIALQMGELILEVKRLETLRDQMADRISELAKQKESDKTDPSHRAANPPQT